MKTKRIHQDVYISVLLYIVSIFFLVISLRLPKNSAIFPVLLIVAFAILNTSLLINGIKKTKVIWNEEPNFVNSINWKVIKKPLIVFVIVVLYSILFRVTNFFIATTIFMIALMKFYKVKSWVNIILITISLNIIIYVGFVKMLNVLLL
ncbi:MAG: tripartite tricarboxylate transporter TctB family protein [Mahellales bacterium]|jgi:hypothetical protein